jgi:hypothetical protein
MLFLVFPFLSWISGRGLGLGFILLWCKESLKRIDLAALWVWLNAAIR